MLRYYESIGLLPEPQRVNGRRRYEASVLQRLYVIGVAQRAGFTLGEIRELFLGFPSGTTRPAQRPPHAGKPWRGASSPSSMRSSRAST